MGKRRSGVSEPLAFQPSLRPGTKIMGIKPSGRLSYFTTVWACGIIVAEATTVHPAVPVQHPPRSRSQKEAVANTFVFSHTTPYSEQLLQLWSVLVACGIADYYLLLMSVTHYS